jgi:photosystem II stability/assembly factor-like uncharacterized protein
MIVVFNYGVQVKKLFGFLLVITIISNCVLQAQWVQANGPYSGKILCYAENGNDIFAGTYDGNIYRSTNNDRNWTLINFSLYHYSVLSLAMCRSNIFAGTSGKGIFLSTDNGASWSNVYNESPWGADVPSLAVIDTNIFAVTSSGLYLSTNNGSQWNPVNGWNNLSLYTEFNALVVVNKNLFERTINGIIYLSTDLGTSWSIVTNNLPNVNNIDFFTAIGTNLYADIYSSGLYRSTDNGTTWTNIFPNESVSSIVQCGSDLFVLSGGIYRSTDNGISWNNSSNGLPNPPYISSLVVSGNNIIAGMTNCVYLSTDNGANWSPIKSDIEEAVINSIKVIGTNLFAGTNNGVYLSTDKGTSWKIINNGLSKTYVNSLTVKGANLFACTEGDGIFVSTNNGEVWSPINNGLLNTYIKTLFIMSNYMYAGTKNGVYLSTDNGLNWNAINNGMANIVVKTIAAYIDNAGVTNIFAGTSSGVYLSKNQGIDWVAINNGLTNTDVNVLTARSGVLRAGTNGNGFFGSNNNGNSWTSINDELSEQKITCTSDSSGYNSFVGTDGNGVFAFYDDYYWKNFGLEGSSVHSLAGIGPLYNEPILFAGTNNGIWANLHPILVGVEEKKNNLPQNYVLMQNYPNPFNPTTTINYSVSKPGYVKIKVYDLLGRIVATLVNENKPIGNYSVQLNAAKLVSGIYFYRMESGSFSHTKKLLLLK